MVLQLNIKSGKMFLNITLCQNYFRVPAKCHLRMNKQMTVDTTKFSKYQYSYMFQTHKVIIRLVLEHF